MKYRSKIFLINFALVICIFTFLLNNAFAGVYQWNGDQNSNWSNHQNWTPNSGGGGPGPGDDVTIVTGNTFNLSSIPAGITIQSLTMTSGVDITLAGDLAITNALNISANTLITAGNALSVGTTTNISAGAFLTSTGGSKTFTGATTNAGTMTMNGTTASLGNYSGAGIFTTSAATDLTLTNAGAADFPNGSLTNLNSLVKNGAGTATINGGLTIAASLVVNAGTLATNSQTFSVGTTTDLTGGSLTSTGGSKTFTGAVTNAGTMTMDGTTVSLGNYSGAGTFTTNAATDLTLTNAGAADFPNGSLSNLNSLVKNGAGTATINGGLTIAGLLDINSGTLATNTQTLSVGTTTDLSGGTFLTSTGGSKTFTGAVTNAGTMTMDGTTVSLGNYSGAGTFTTNATTDLTLTNAGTADFPNGSLSNLNSLVKNGAGTATINGGLTIAGLLDINTGTFATNTQTLSVGTTTDLSGGTFLTSTGGSKTFTGAVTNAGTMTMNGTTVSLGNYSGAGTFTTSAATALTLNNAGAADFPNGSLTNLSSLTKNGAGTATINGGLTIAGLLDINTGTFATNTQTLSVGTTTDISGGASLTSTGGSKTFSGAVAINGTLDISGTSASFGSTLVNNSTFTTNASTNLTFTGGAVFSLPAASANLTNLSIGGTSAITLSGALALSGTLSVTSSAATGLITGNNGLSVVSTTTVGASATISSTGGSKTFTGAVTNSGTMTMNGTNVSLGNYAGGGIFTTNASTDLTLTNAGVASFSAASLSNLNTMVKNAAGNVLLGRGLIIASTLVINNGTLNTNTQTVQVGSTTNIAGGSFTSTGGTKTFTGDVTNNSTLNLTGATSVFQGVFTNNATLTTSAGTSLTFNGATTLNLPVASTSLTNLTVSGSSAVTLQANLTLSGLLALTSTTAPTLITAAHNLSVSSTTNIAATSSLTSTGGIKTFTAAFTNAGTATLTNTSVSFGNNYTNSGTTTLTGASASFAGNFTNSGTFTTTNATNLTFSGTTAVSLPAGAPRALASLTINKTTGDVSLTSVLSLGNAGATVLTISNAAHLDLAGFNATMQHADDIINESSSGTIINTGALGTYIQTAATLTTAQVNASGIGISAISVANVTADHRVRRYPQKATYLINCTETIFRIYEFIGTMTGITTFGLEYAVSEMNGASQGTLNMYRCADISFAIPTLVTTSDSYNNPFGTATGTTLPVNGEFFVLVGVDPAKKIIKTFTGNIDNDWDKGDNWSPNCIPEYLDHVIIPNGFDVVTTNNISAAILEMNGDATLNLGHNAVIAGRSDGGIELNGSSSITISAGIIIEIGTADYRGDIELNNSSSITFGGAMSTVTLSGTWTKNSAATIVNTFPPTFFFVGPTPTVLPLTLNDAVEITIDKLNSSVTLTDDMTVSTNVSLDNGDFIIGNNDLEITGTTDIAANTTLNADYTERNTTRIFTGVVTIDGTLSSVGHQHTDNTTPSYNNTFTAALVIPITGVLDVNYSRTIFSSTMSVAGAGAVMNALGADVRFFDAVTWTNLTFNTNDNTDLTFEVGAAQDLLEMDLKNLTLNDAQTYRMTGDIVLTGDFTAANVAGELDMAGYSLTVHGTFSSGAAFTTNPSVNTSELVLNGPISSWGLVTDANDLNLNLIVGGSGTITPATVNASVDALRSLTMSRAGTNLQFAGGAAFAIGTTMTISAGTVTAQAGQTFGITGDASIGLNGIFVCNGATSVTLNAVVTGTGIIDADHADDELRITSNNFDFTGTLKTANTTIIEFNNAGPITVTMPASVEQLEDLQLLGGGGHNITLSNNLTITTQLASATNLPAGAIITVNGYKLTLSGGVAAVTGGTIVATSASTLEFGASSDFAGIQITEDETTNLIFNTSLAGQVAATLSQAILECNNLTITSTGIGAFQVSISATSLTVHGNLNVGNACTFLKNAFPLTVYGDYSSSGTSNLIGAGAVTLYGQLQGTGFMTDPTTALTVRGTSSQFVLPAGVATLASLTLNRANGMRLTGDLDLGAAGVLGTLTLTSGDLDLNGYVIDMLYDLNAGASTLISETAGNTVINTGASGSTNGYLQVSSATQQDARIAGSGIGIISIATGATAIEVRRYPITIPVPEVGLSTSRVFQINTATPTALTLQYDNSELNSNASDLKLYTSSSLVFAVKDDRTSSSGANRTVNQNTPTGKGNVAYSSLDATAPKNAMSAGLFYALASVPGDGGVMRTAMNSGNWNSPATWSPSGIPTKVDQVVIGPATITLNGSGVTYDAKTLLLNHANSTLQPANNTINGDAVNLRVMGDIELTSGSEILGAVGTGRLNLIIGDGTTIGVSSTITVNNDYVATSGIWVHNLTVNMADVSLPSTSGRMRISGDVSLVANSAVALDDVEFWGGFDANQTILVPASANLSFATVTLANSAGVATTSDFTLTDHFLIASGSTFNATGGNASFTSGGAGKPWNIETGGTLKLYNTEFNASAGGSFTPLGTAYIQGNFWQYGTQAFAPTSGRVIFSNTVQKEIVNTNAANPERLIFYALELAPNAKVITSNSWQVGSEIDVKTNASLIADNGEISFVGAAPAVKWIKNVSTHTLEFNDLAVSAGVVQTNDSWTIRGNLDVQAGTTLLANNGTITFDNIQEKSIEASGTLLQFFKLKITDGSKLTTANNHDFTIANNATNLLGSGIEVEGTGEFYVGNASSVITFETGIGLTSGYPKTITKSAAGRLEFGKLSIAASPNNEVSTSSDFTLTGTGTQVFSNLGAGGKFTATGGEIAFTGATPEIESVSPGVTQFFSIKTLGITELTFPTAGAPTVQEVYVAGNIVINGQSFISADDDADTKIIINGSDLQTIGGNSTALVPIVIPDFVLNKSNNSELLLEINTVLGEVTTNTDDELTLTNGILNLGSKTLTVHSDIISRSNGVINGGTGTYIVATNHQTPKLEDVYFTVNGLPTLYNLTLNTNNLVPQTIANDLTVNGTLNLNTADLTIASGTTSASPVKLILNGNLTRTSGEILSASPTLSRLVLQGTGLVVGGLSNTYFSGSETNVQLEIARAETLGGNLQINNATDLRINSGINDFDLGTNTLTFETSFSLVMISGGIKSGTNSSVVLPNVANIAIPASMFRNDEVYNLNISNDISISGDLTINGTLTGARNITTNDNTLTFGPNATLPVFTSTACVKGNLRRYVTNAATSFPIGNGSADSYMPVTLQFANSGSSQAVRVSRKYIDPVVGRGGSATNSVDALWNITPEGTAPVDSLKAVFSWPSALDGGTTPAINASFPAKWNGLSWTDYRNRLNSFTPATPRVLTMNGFAVQNSAALAGDWAIFNASANTNSAKDAAIAVDANRIVITNITPTPVITNNAFKVTFQLQDRFGQPITLQQPFAFTLSKTQGATFADFSGVIPAGESMATVSGLSCTSASGNTQLKADTSGGSLYWTSTVSELFDVLPSSPSTQAKSITFTNVSPTSMTITWDLNGGTNAIVLIKPDTLLQSNEFPINGTTYFANTIVGAGSNLGEATTIYNGTGTTVNITGLAPNTKYFVYVFNYDKSANDFNENYRTTASSGNPKAQTTGGSFDDDLNFGVNNTRTLSKAIGTNTPIKGTIRNASDVDWFNFTVTNVSPNLRAQIYNLPGNYTLELYDMSGRRIRRSTLNGTSTEAAVINDLPSGTYTVRIFSQDGTYWTRTGEEYTLKISTFGKEIFAVTE